MRRIIEKYYPHKNETNKTFYECFLDSIVLMENKEFQIHEIEKEVNERNNLLNCIKHGLSLCISSCKPIVEHQYELEINAIFTRDEITAIEYLYEECESIMICSKLPEIGERVHQFVDWTIDNIVEIREKANMKIEFKNGIIRNISSIMN